MRPFFAARARAVVAAVLLTLWAPSVAAAADWRPALTPAASPSLTPAFALDAAALGRRLDRAPLAGAAGTPVVVAVPAPDGTLQRFSAVETPVLSPALQREHPDVRAYRATGLTDPTARASLVLTPEGFSASVTSGGGTWLVDPVDPQRPTAYRSGYRDDLVTDRAPVEAEPVRPAGVAPSPAPAQRGGGPTSLRTYRLALVSDPSYRAAVGGTGDAVTAAKAALVARVNQIYEDDLGIRLELVGPDSVTDPAVSPFTKTACADLLSQNQAYLDAAAIPGGYDVGHLVLGSGGGGMAGVGVVGKAGQKARGCTGTTRPYGDGFAVDYVAHELGHQFGANHTFNGTGGNCAGNRWGPSAVEPGSGSSVMAYAGICGADDLQRNSDPYFSQRSIAEIAAYVASSPAAGGAVQATTNRAPEVTAGVAAATIPVRTPFRLTGTVTDPDAGDVPVASWEQDDTGVTRALLADDKPSGALFRQFSSAATEADPAGYGADGEHAATPGDVTRTLPDAAQVAADATNAATGACPATAARVECASEFLPTSARTLHFRLTARDRSPLGGGTSSDDTVLTVAGTAPFRVTAPAAPATVGAGQAVPVTWDVAGTDAAPFGVTRVRLRWSTDGGLTFPTVLADDVPNTGAATITIPPGDTTQGRVEVEAVGSVFFDVSHADLTVSGVAPRAAAPEPAAAAPAGGVLGASAAGTPPGRLRPVLTGVARRLRVRRGVVAVPVRCARLAAGALPARCAGTVTLRARTGGRTRTVATARFAVRRGARAVVRLRLGAAARRALARGALQTTVRVVVRNPGAASATGSRGVRLTAPRRPAARRP